MRCKYCRKKINDEDEKVFIPLGVLHRECLDDYIQQVITKQKRRKAKIKKEIKKAKYRQVKSKMKNTAWVYFSRYIRLKHADQHGYCTCITCGKRKKWNKGIDAGHFIPKSAGEYFYFNEDNIRPQCRKCNYYSVSQDSKYRDNLVAEIGEEKVKDLEQKKFNTPIIKRTLEDYRKLAKKYYKKYKELEKPLK